jgi:hypothetical protein
MPVHVSEGTLRSHFPGSDFEHVRLTLPATVPAGHAKQNYTQTLPPYANHIPGVADYCWCTITSESYVCVITTAVAGSS